MDELAKEAATQILNENRVAHVGTLDIGSASVETTTELFLAIDAFYRACGRKGRLDVHPTGDGKAELYWMDFSLAPADEETDG